MYSQRTAPRLHLLPTCPTSPPIGTPRLKPLRNLLSLHLHVREIRGALPPGLFRCLSGLQHLSIAARCRLPAGVVHQLSGLRSLELHGASLDAAAAQAAAELQQLTRLGISVEGGWRPQQCAEGEEPAEEPAAGAGAGTPPRSSSPGGSDGSPGKGGGGGVVRRWQEHAIWGHLPQLTQLQVLLVGAELPACGGEGGGEGGDGSEGGEAQPAILPYDCLEGGVPDGIMDCLALTHLALPVALTHLPDLVPGQLPCLRVLDLTHSIAEALPPSWCSHAQVRRVGVQQGGYGCGGVVVAAAWHAAGWLLP